MVRKINDPKRAARRNHHRGLNPLYQKRLNNPSAVKNPESPDDTAQARPEAVALMTPPMPEPQTKDVRKAPRLKKILRTNIERNELDDIKAQEKQEVVIFYLLLFFIGSLLTKVSFGIISGSEPLFVSGIFALFGIFISVLHMLRVQGNDPSKREEEDIRRDKLEFTIIAGSSILIALTSGVMLVVVLHVTLFHRLAPPLVVGGWIAALIAAVDIFILYWIKQNSEVLEEIDLQKIVFLLSNDLILSSLVFLTVVITQWGFHIMDNIVAVLASIYILIYSVYFIRVSYHGLMGAETNHELLAEISGHVKTAVPAMKINSIKLNSIDKILEIVCMIHPTKNMKVTAAQKTVDRIKLTLKKKLTIPHEVHIGFEEL